MAGAVSGAVEAVGKRPGRPPSPTTSIPPGLSVAQRKAFAFRFREAREAAGLTQERVSELTGISRAHLSGIETARENMTVETMAALARAVGLELQILLSPPRPRRKKS